MFSKGFELKRNILKKETKHYTYYYVKCLVSFFKIFLFNSKPLLIGMTDHLVFGLHLLY